MQIVQIEPIHRPTGVPAIEAQARTAIPSLSEPLGEILQLLRLEGTLYCCAELTAPWGIEIPDLPGMMTFFVVSDGEFWIEIEGAAPRKFHRGDLVLIPHGHAYLVRSELGAEYEALDDIPVEQLSERYETMHYGGGGALTSLTCGVVRYDHVAGRRLIEQLPPMVYIDTWSDEADDWLQSTVRFITREARTLQPGGETMITRLADALVLQALRLWLMSAQEETHGWIAALRDDQVGRALIAMHRDPARDWDVDTMARNVGMSRSNFSQRFTELVGESPARYLTNWRLQRARIQLMDSQDTINTIAEAAGYLSQSAFSRAFKQYFGVSPGSVRH